MFENLKIKDALETEIRALIIEFDNAIDKQKLEIESILLDKKIQLNKLKKDGRVATKAVSAFDLIQDVNSRPSIPRYSTGVDALDEKLNGGIEIGSFVQLAGGSFAGKTHLAIEILSQIANREKVLFFNFEMGDRRIAHRFEKSLQTEDARRNMLIHNDNRELSHIVDEIKSSYKNGVKFFAIDSKMKIEVSDEKDDYKKFSKISATLSKLTQENEIIIFLINQVSEDDDKNLRLSFKGSGDQLYDTDLALFYLLVKDNPNIRKLVCRKNRQDESNFSLTLKLNSNNKTVLADEIPTVHERANSKAVYKVKEASYNDNLSMGVI
ncbi:MAG: DnaB-like helicase C-terminal domain-containing protein [Campylobacterota bacterium]|nr:DnaB-like helicase C-terminal domain-containing protein [Campylobacterota bacterium]